MLHVLTLLSWLWWHRASDTLWRSSWEAESKCITWRLAPRSCSHTASLSRRAGAQEQHLVLPGGCESETGRSSLRFLVLFVHPHRFLGVCCCCEHWIMLSMYVWHAEVYSSLTKWFRHTCQPTLKERPNYTTLSVCFPPSLLSFNKLYYYAEYCKKGNIKKKHHMPKTSQLSFSFRQCCRGTYSLSKAIELLMQSRMRESQASLKITEECQIDRRYPCGWQS